MFKPIPLVEIAESDIDVCGGKAVGLALLVRKKLPVPEGFVLPVGCFEHLARGVDIDLNTTKLSEIREAIGEMKFPEELLESVLREARLLGLSLIHI